MSNLRLFGIFVGSIGIVVTFLRYRGPKWKKSSFIVLIIMNICILSVSINPNTANFIRSMLAMEQYQYGRLFALLIVSNIFLLFFSFYSRAKQNALLFQFDNLVRRLSAYELEQNVRNLVDRIKPVMVVIPAFNEAENLRLLLPRIPQMVGGVEVGVLVVDDGSEDDTKEAVRENGHLVVSSIINRGGGAALRLGYDIVSTANSVVCVTMDADGQHRPEEINDLASPVLKGEFDIVIGSRVLGRQEKNAWARSMGVLVFGHIISFLLGKKITDPSSGFRAFNLNIMKPISLFEDQYHTSELIIEAVRKGMRIDEVPITILKRQHGKSKKGKDLIYGLRFARTIVKTWWRR